MELNIKALRRLMAAQGYNVASLARAAGVSAQAVNVWLKHGVTPRIDTLGKLARALGVDIYDLTIEEELQ